MLKDLRHMLYLPTGIPIMIANSVGFKNNRSLWAESGLSWCWSSSVSDGDPVALPTACFCVPTHKFLMLTSNTRLRLLVWVGMWDGVQQYALLLLVSSTSVKNPATADPNPYLNSCVYLDTDSSATELLWLCLIIRHAYKWTATLLFGDWVGTLQGELVVFEGLCLIC